MWILEGTCHNPGHDWKDGHKRGKKVLAYTRTLPPPYAPDQHPRVGNTGATVTPEHFHFERIGLIKFLRLIPTIIRDAREQRKWRR